jgi:hypothetical protein
MQAMLIPPLPMQAPDGIRVYPGEPTVQDQKTDRGEFVYGRRIQSAKYFIQKEGDYTLPPIELKWWNLSTNRLVTAALPAVHLTASANPNYVAELPPEAEPTPVAQPRRASLWSRYKFWIRVVAPTCVACLLLLLIGWFYVPRAFRRLQAWQTRREHSEAAYFRKLQQACRRNRAIEAYACLLKWLTLSYPGATVGEFLSRSADPALEAETNPLGAALFKRNERDSHWNGRRLADLAKQHRAVKHENATKRSELGKLNP